MRERPTERHRDADRDQQGSGCKAVPLPQLFLAPANPPSPEVTSTLLPRTPHTGVSCAAGDLAAPGSSVGPPPP